MRPRPVVKAFTPALTALALLLAGTACVLMALPAQAQTQQQPSSNPDANANAIAQTLGGGAPTPAAQQQGQIQTGQPAPGFYPSPGFYYPPGYQPQIFGPPAPTEEEVDAAQLDALLKNPDSPQYKANKLADKAKRDGDVINFARSTVVDEKETVTDIETPPELDTLQDVHETHGTTYNVADAEIEEELLNLDIRRDAQKEAALSYGARGGLAKRNYQLAERLQGYEGVLDQVFNFRALLVRAPSGLLIEPPIVRESLENIFVNGDGSEAAVADAVLDINKQAKIVTAPRDWRNYLLPAYESEITPPPRVLWPKDDKEQAEWNSWVKQGWTAGYEQGEETFETNLNQLTSDYNGMVRYRLLLAQGMISAPFALHEDRGVTGTATLMRVGDRALRLTGPSQFLTGSDLWKPADR